MTKPLRILLVEDNDDDADLMVRELQRRGSVVSPHRVDSVHGVEAALAAETWDVVLSDFGLPTCTGLDVLRAVRERDPHVPFLFVSGSIGEEVAAAAMRAGAHDYILKDNLARLAPAVIRELQDAAERREHHRVADQLRQAQKMELVARLAGGVAHDFNNMLAVVILSADLARKDSPASVQPLLDDIVHAAKDGAALTRQLLALGRRQALVPSQLDVNELIRGQESLLRRLGGEKVELTLDLDPEVAEVNADPTQLEQVVLNLCVNAKDAMPHGGRLTISTGHAGPREAIQTRHDVIPPGDYTLITVTDTGVGMRREVRERLFEPFFSTKGEGRGTGLGLSVVHGIVTQSQGYVAVDSEPGRGATFRVYLPCVEGRTSPVRAAHTTTPDARGTEVLLLAEDDAGLRRAATLVLERAGYTVLDAEDADQALLLARQYRGRIHLLISDVVMPGMDGPELLVQLRRERPDLRVLFCSGYLPDHISRQSAVTADGVLLAKPFTMADLVTRVRDVLDAP